MLSITKEFRFEAAHRISNHQGNCKNLHGHSYKLFVTVGADQLNEGDMIIDFKTLKEIVNDQVLTHFDHTLILKKNKENEDFADLSKQKIYWFDNEPTVERMLLFIKEAIISSLPSQVFLQALRLYETETSFGEWKKEN